MQISYQWLRDYVKLPDSIEPETLAEKLKLSTVEVEGILRPYELLENVVVGKVLKADKHPQADKLKVCTVDIGGEESTIVCGGSNVKEGMLCAVAKLGAKVKWHGEGEPVVMEKASIRGVESFGMICGADEIGLLELFPKKDEKEIVDLTDLKLKVGKPLAEALKLNDVIFEIDNKSLSNRPDLWGHYGLAREVAALTSRNVHPLKISDITPGKSVVTVKVDDHKDCPRYMAVAIEGIKIAPSPLWLKQRLIAAGIRPINNVVDVTNYVMLALGQPLHAFDVRQLTSEKGMFIGVRSSTVGEKFTTLDGKDRDLPEGTLLITSHQGPVAIAGIMGGLNSEVKDDTVSIVIESANFSGTLIRKTSNLLNLRTDASARFEKKLDPAQCESGLALAVETLLKLNPSAKIVSKVADVGDSKKRVRPLEMPSDFIEKFSGVKIPLKTSLTILERLGFASTVKGEFVEIMVPSWRAEDVVSPEAVVEEVLRIHGYQNVTGTLPSFVISPPVKNVLRDLERKCGEIAVKDFGFYEVYNYSFVSADQLKKLGEDPALSLELDNPLSKEKPFLRRTLLPNLLEVFKKNSDYASIKVFEIGQTYRKELPGFRTSSGGSELLPRQDTFFTALVYDRSNDQPFGAVKKLAIKIFADLGVEIKFGLTEADNLAHPSRFQQISLNNGEVGSCFELHPRIVKNFGIEGRVGVLTVNLSVLSENVPKIVTGHFNPLPLYPEVERDIAFVVDKKVTNAEIVDLLKEVDPLLKKVEMFDAYEGSKLPENKKSVAYHLIFSNPERTLTSEEVGLAENKIKAVLIEKLHAEFR